ncbi:MAG: hypothetical protein JST32_19520 [Bacteroidetes bacterium]|nr:hypothetical protein [Bacteroidota bacterium]
MAVDNKKIFFGMGLIAIFLVSVMLTQTYNVMRKAEVQKKRLSEIGKLQFRGKVVGVRTYRYYNKNYYQVCVKLDYSTVDNLSLFNDLDCIRINKGMATFSAGYLNNILGPVDSISANIGNNGKVIFYYKTHATDSHPLGFEPMGLKEGDLNYCN